MCQSDYIYSTRSSDQLSSCEDRLKNDLKKKKRKKPHPQFRFDHSNGESMTKCILIDRFWMHMRIMHTEHSNRSQTIESEREKSQEFVQWMSQNRPHPDTIPKVKWKHNVKNATAKCNRIASMANEMCNSNSLAIKFTNVNYAATQAH